MAPLRHLLSFPLLFLALLCIGTRLAGSAPVPSSASGLSFSLSTLASEERDEGLAFFLPIVRPRQLAERSVRVDDLSERDMADDFEDIMLVRRKSIFNKIKDGFKKVGKGIKNAAKKVGEGVKKAAKKVGKGVKTAAKKVGKFVKDTGAKVVKFGAKVLSTAQSIGSKVAKFIPGVGKPISAALSGASKATGAIADKIPAKLGKKLDKGFKVMDKIQHPVKGAAGAALDALRREVDEETGLFERDVDLEEIDARDLFDQEELLERRGYREDEFDTLL